MPPVAHSPTASPLPTAVPVENSLSPNVPFTTQPLRRKFTTTSPVNQEHGHQKDLVTQEGLNLLSKITVSAELNNNNYFGWLQSVIVALQGIGYNHYLLNENTDPKQQSPSQHQAIRQSICSWLISHLDSQNATQLNTKFQTSTPLLKHIRPTSIWNTVKKFCVKNIAHHMFEMAKTTPKI